MKSATTATVADLLELLWQLMNDEGARPSERLAAARDYARLRGFGEAGKEGSGPVVLNLYLTNGSHIKKS